MPGPSSLPDARWSLPIGAVVHVRYTAVCSFEGKGGHRGRKHIVPD